MDDVNQLTHDELLKKLTRDDRALLFAFALIEILIDKKVATFGEIHDGL